MKLTIYLKNYFLHDIILLLVISGVIFLVLNTWEKNEVTNDTAVELIPLNIHPDDEIG